MAKNKAGEVRKRSGEPYTGRGKPESEQRRSGPGKLVTSVRQVPVRQSICEDSENLRPAAQSGPAQPLQATVGGLLPIERVRDSSQGRCIRAAARHKKKRTATPQKLRLANSSPANMTGGQPVEPRKGRHSDGPSPLTV